jgi:hypothetical protein
LAAEEGPAKKGVNGRGLSRASNYQLFRSLIDKEKRGYNLQSRMHQRFGGPNGPIAYKFGSDVQKKAFQDMRDTSQAEINPDHLMDLVY